MIRSHAPLVLFSLSLFFSAGSYASEKEFDQVCNYFDQLDKLSNVNSMSNTQRNDFINNKISKNLAETSNARAAWIAIDSAVAELRYELFQSAAESVINKPWQCPSMQKWAAKTGEF